MKYDIVGDIHGHADELKLLLQKLGYQQDSTGVFNQSGHQAIYVGDFIDRGQQNIDVINIVKPMVATGNAQAVMGNHEYNAICYYTRHPETDLPLREHSAKNTKQHRTFLAEMEGNHDLWHEIIDWFKTLPLYLDLGHLRVVHAEWNQSKIDSVKTVLPTKNTLSDDFIIRSVQAGSIENLAVESLLKGSEAVLPMGITFKDKDGHKRNAGRLCWWENSQNTADLFMVPEEVKKKLVGVNSDDVLFTPYDTDFPPVFFGHYWLNGKPVLQAENAVCVDYSVAKTGGKLCCYRFAKGETISKDNFLFCQQNMR